MKPLNRPPLSSLILAFSLFLYLPATFAQTSQMKDGPAVFYYPNGNKASEGLMRNGKPDGYWKTYYENGTLKSEGNRKEFELDSIWKFYDETGNLTTEINYQAGKKNGLRKTYREEETISENFVNDVKQGLTTVTNNQGMLLRTIPFTDGLENGLSKEFAPDGRVITLVEYKKGFITSQERINRMDKNGWKQGGWKFFHPNGLVKTEGTYRDDKRDGYFKDYDTTGSLIATFKYIDDVKQEEAPELARLQMRTEYYPDGKIKKTTTYKENIPEGVSREYSEEGKIISSEIFRNGKVIGKGIVEENGRRTGFWQEYDEEGNLRAEGNYLSGKRTGEWKFYFANGNVEQKGKYDDKGQPVGKWIWYFADNTVRREENYLKGLLDGMMTEYHDTGEVIAEGEYIEGEEEGPWLVMNGEMREEGEFSMGERSGVWKYFFPDGSLSFEGEFIDGNPNGKHVYYYDNGKVRDEIEYVMGIKQGEWKQFDSEGNLEFVITYDNGYEKKWDGVDISNSFEGLEDD